MMSCYEACARLHSATTPEELGQLAVSAFMELGGAKGVCLWRDPESPPLVAGDATGVAVSSDLVAAAFATHELIHAQGVLLHPIALGGVTLGVLASDSGAAHSSDAWLGLMHNLAVAIKNADGYAMLEALVEEEMATAVQRELAMQLVLDSMRDGLFVCDRRGYPTEVRSAAIERWLGPADGVPIWDYLGGDDSAVRSAFQLGFEQLAEDFLPFEVNAAQMPSRFEREGRMFELEYHPVQEADVLSAVVVVVSDATERIAAQRAESEQRELVQIVQVLVSNRGGFIAFLGDMKALLERLPHETSGPVRDRVLHTIKGNAAVFGFRHFASLCHDLEDECAEGGVSADACQRLSEQWGYELRKIEEFVSEGSREGILLQSEELEFLMGELEANGLEELLHAVRGWRHELLAELLEPQVRRAQALAEQHGKQVSVSIDTGSLRIPSAKLRSVVTNLVHVFRNAVDHGLESPDERESAGKPRVGTLCVGALRAGDQFALWVEDDGRGIDWRQVSQVAARKGLRHETHNDLLDALFADGLSTRRTVTETSGRGVGMSALKEACDALGGRISVRSELGVGTRFEFFFSEPTRFMTLIPQGATTAGPAGARDLYTPTHVAGD